MINNNLKSCREFLGLTQKELGKKFNVAESTISGWENNNDIIPLKRLINFCNMFNFSLDYVTGLSRKNKIYDKVKIIDNKEIGLKLKKIRKNLDITQQELASECSISQTTYSNYELGINLISTLTLFTICKNHNLSMDEILGRKEHK